MGIYSGCVFRTVDPRATYNITAGGRVTISGLLKLDDVKIALQRLYSELQQCGCRWMTCDHLSVAFTTSTLISVLRILAYTLEANVQGAALSCTVVTCKIP